MTAAEAPVDILRRSVENVLDAMFFESPNEEPQIVTRPAPGSLTAAVSFDGSQNGRMLVAMTSATAAALAVNFLGLEKEVSGYLEESTLLEFANICCGSFLSRLNPHGLFHIRAPQLVATPAGGTDWLAMRLECGAISFCLEWHRPEWSAASPQPARTV